MSGRHNYHIQTVAEWARPFKLGFRFGKLEWVRRGQMHSRFAEPQAVALRVNPTRPRSRWRSLVNRRPSPRFKRCALRVAARRRLASRTLLAFGRGPGSGAPPAARATSAAAPDPGARAYWLLRRECEGRGPAPPLPLPPAGAGCSLSVPQLLTRCSGGITPARPHFS